MVFYGNITIFLCVKACVAFTWMFRYVFCLYYHSYCYYWIMSLFNKIIMDTPPPLLALCELRMSRVEFWSFFYASLNNHWNKQWNCRRFDPFFVVKGSTNFEIYLDFTHTCLYFFITKPMRWVTMVTGGWKRLCSAPDTLRKGATGDIVSICCLSLQWRHNDNDGVSNHQPHVCLLNRLFRRGSKKTSKLRVTGLCVGNSPGPVNSPHKGPVTWKMFPFDDVIMHFAVCSQIKSEV